jgi:hypothetical protein
VVVVVVRVWCYTKCVVVVLCASWVGHANWGVVRGSGGYPFWSPPVRPDGGATASERPSATSRKISITMFLILPCLYLWRG